MTKLSQATIADIRELTEQIENFLSDISLMSEASASIFSSIGN
jgi:hypothetical protein